MSHSRWSHGRGGRWRRLPALCISNGLSGAAGRGRTALVSGVAALVTATRTLLAGLPGQARAPPAVAGTVDWAAHGGDAGHTQYSPLEQITPANVAALQVAWTYHTGDARADGRSQIQCNPIVVHGVLYATSPQLKVFALDAATGAAEVGLRSVHGGRPTPSSLGVNRGVVYWEGDGGRDAHPRRRRRTLFALDAATGRPIASFGSKGGVDLRDGLGRRRASALRRSSNTPGAIYKDLLILGTRVGEGPGPSAPGHVRAYDVRTGAIALDVPHHPAARRAGLRHLAARRLDARRRRQRLERHHRRRDARARVPADRLGGVRLLGRQPPRRRTSSPTACSC